MDRNELVERELLAQPVRSLQYMLRRLSRVYPFLPEITADGIFGERTLEAVMLFQRELYPPVTGVVDSGTWNAIRTRWEQAERQLAAPRAVRAYPGEPGKAGVARGNGGMSRTMFRELSRYLDGIAPDDGSGPESEENIRWLQRSAGLEETGELDVQTWNALTRLYEVFSANGGRPAGPALKGGWG